MCGRGSDWLGLQQVSVIPAPVCPGALTVKQFP